ncbi:MAG: hypothetical protein KJ667_00745 [Alphaproteobacteria bacterium]|nr:hypothetical protein [Alphaproteobacteria bacterium]
MGSQTKPDTAQAVPENVDDLLAMIARRHATSGAAHREGSSILYEIGPGWEAAIMARDPAVRRVTTTFALEDAFMDPSVSTILIPHPAAITLTVARRICGRHGMAKTVFFEGGQDEQG